MRFLAAIHSQVESRDPESPRRRPGEAESYVTQPWLKKLGLPAAQLYEPKLPKPQLYKADLPKPQLYNAGLPKLQFYELDLPEPQLYELNLPEPQPHEQDRRSGNPYQLGLVKVRHEAPNMIAPKLEADALTIFSRAASKLPSGRYLVTGSRPVRVRRANILDRLLYGERAVDDVEYRGWAWELDVQRRWFVRLLEGARADAHVTWTCRGSHSPDRAPHQLPSSSDSSDEGSPPIDLSYLCPEQLKARKSGPRFSLHDVAAAANLVTAGAEFQKALATQSGHAAHKLVSGDAASSALTALQGAAEGLSLISEWQTESHRARAAGMSGITATCAVAAKLILRRALKLGIGALAAPFTVGTPFAPVVVPILISAFVDRLTS